MTNAAPPSVDWNEIARLAISDEKAFVELYEHFFPRVYRYLLAKTADYSIADETVSQTFFNMYNHLRDFDPQKGAFSTWLFRIAQNELNDCYRKNRRRDARETVEDTTLFAPDEDMPETRVLTKERHDELYGALALLSDRDRRIVEMTYWLGLKSEDIARELDMMPSSVRVALKRAREKLKKILS